ncbi:hypothetical protein [Bacillus toyonensis]
MRIQEKLNHLSPKEYRR